MTNTSASGGFLAPSSTAPVEDDALDDVMTTLILGITSVTAGYVRPRWQPIPQKQPEASTDWCAFGVVNEAPLGNAAFVHHPDGDGFDELQQHEKIDVLCSFYGPSARGNAARLRDGLYVAQNREGLFLAHFGFVETSAITFFPELVSNTWVRRADITIFLRRAVTRVYPINNILEGVGTIESDVGDSQPWDTANKR